MILFYDFEVFAHDWLVVIISPADEKEYIFHNDREGLIEFYNGHKSWIWCGYNSRNYDSVILKAIIIGFDPKRISDYIIYQGLKSWQIDPAFRTIQLFDYDAYILNTGLKQLEAFMGNDIRETSVPFDIQRPLTPDELELTIGYCRHDVEQLIEVFTRKIDDFNAQMDLIRTFNLPLSYISKTKAQLTAEILGCTKRERFDEWDIKIVPTLRLDKYAYVKDWFLNPSNHNYEKSLEIEVAGLPHSFGWGGLHGAPNKPIHRKGLLIHVDVTSYYPSLMIEYDFLTRNCRRKSKFKEIYDKRVELKKAGMKAAQAPYKIVLNSTFGVCKDSMSKAYDPQMSNNVVINGQLLLLDLIEKLEGHCELIQSNTDGLIIQVKDTDAAFDKVDDICWEWEQRTRMSLGFDTLNEIWQGDVNNYVFRFDNGKLERKGGYVKELGDLDNDLPIVNEAIVKYLTEGAEVESTVNSCGDLKQFQKVVKISGKYKFGWHNGERLSDKTFRVFASTYPADTYIGKCKDENAKVEKFANTPLHCFIENGDVNGKPCPAKLDKRWYIVLAKKRLRDKFGIDFPGDTLQLELDFGEPKPKPKKKAEAKPAPVPEQKYEFDIF
jgi:hypothetical protein